MFANGIDDQSFNVWRGYSSISQMGVIAAALGMVLASGDASAAALVAFAAANHVLVKVALFLALGAVFATDLRRKRWAPPLMAALGLSLAGLPFTGGTLAKLALKAPLGYGLPASLSYASAAGTALLMLHFLMCLSRVESGGTQEIPSSLQRSWPFIALGAIVLPWLFYPAVGDLSDTLRLAQFWDGLWPVLIGAALALGLARWGEKLPRIPAGDTVVVGEAAFKSCFALGELFENLDMRLRFWSAGGLSLVTIGLILAALIAHGG